MAINVGDRLPGAKLYHMTADGPAAIESGDLFAGKKVAVFAVPGAFTPTCSNTHLPGFVANADRIKAKGVDEIVCLSVNDPFVMAAWGKAQNADEIHMVADADGAFSEALGLTLDLSGAGLGTRSTRYSMLVEDGTVKSLNVEASPAEASTSSADAMLEQL